MGVVDFGKKRCGSGEDNGFTLLELLISMTILTMIVVIIFGAFRVGVRAWEKGENSVSARQRQQVVMDLIKHQLASMCTAEIRDRQDRRVRFRGDNRSMAFVSHLALTPGRPLGPVYVEYVVQTDGTGETVNLSFSERPVTAADQGETDFYELLSGAGRIGFEYLKIRADEARSPWQDAWDPGGDGSFPRAVRITFTENDNKAPVYVIAAAGG